LNGRQVAELKFSEVLKGNIYFRIEAEYFAKKYLETEKLLRDVGSVYIKTFADVTDGEHGSPDLDESSGIVYLSGQNILDNTLDLDDIRFCSKTLHQRNSRSALVKNNILMSIVGTVGSASVIYKDILGNTDRNVATIKNITSKFSPYFVSTFLNCKYGKNQTERFSTGNVQPLLNLLQVKSILIPEIDFFLQTQVENLVKQAHRKLDESKAVYAEANNLLLNELGLREWSPSNKNTAVKSLRESFLDSGRLDAEYYQLKYDEMKNVVKANAVSVCHVKSIETFNQRGEQPRYIADGKLRVINSRHILEQHLDYENLERTNADEWETFPLARVFRNDVLIYTTGANVGRTNVYMSDEPALASNHVNILRIENANPVYVGFVLNSYVGRMQTRQIVTGSAQAELYSNAISQFIMPFISDNSQRTITDYVEKSYLLKVESRRLLEVAKRAVEIAIEENEQAAFKFIKTVN